MVAAAVVVVMLTVVINVAVRLAVKVMMVMAHINECNRTVRKHAVLNARILNIYKACYCPAFAPETFFTEAVSLAASLGGFRLSNHSVQIQQQFCA